MTTRIPKISLENLVFSEAVLTHKRKGPRSAYSDTINLPAEIVEEAKERAKLENEPTLQIKIFSSSCKSNNIDYGDHLRSTITTPNKQKHVKYDDSCTVASTQRHIQPISDINQRESLQSKTVSSKRQLHKVPHR